MANATDPLARQIHGSDPQHLVEKIVRLRIYESRFWKERCFGLTVVGVVDEAERSLDYVGGVYGASVKPTPFLCLVLKLLQIQPSEAIVAELVAQTASKYLRALAAFYARLTLRAAHCRALLEPLLADRRKLARRTAAGWALTHVDELADELLEGATCCGIALPRLTSRAVLVATGALPPRASALDEEIDDDEEEEEEEEERQDEREEAAGRAGSEQQAGERPAASSSSSSGSSAAAAAAPAAASSSTAGGKRPRVEGGGGGGGGGGFLSQLKRRAGGGGDGAGAGASAPLRDDSAAAGAPPPPPPPPNSVAAWNAERAKLGLAPLK